MAVSQDEFERLHSSHCAEQARLTKEMQSLHEELDEAKVALDQLSDEKKLLESKHREALADWNSVVRASSPLKTVKESGYEHHTEEAYRQIDVKSIEIMELQAVQARLRSSIQQHLSEIMDLKKERDGLYSDIQTNLDEMKDLKKDRDALNSKFRETLDETTKLTDELAELRFNRENNEQNLDEIEVLKGELAELQSIVQQRADQIEELTAKQSAQFNAEDSIGWAAATRVHAGVQASVTRVDIKVQATPLMTDISVQTTAAQVDGETRSNSHGSGFDAALVLWRPKVATDAVSKRYYPVIIADREGGTAAGSF
ncbi:hypothetical protein BD410DRAFT_809097 [Rickenella mellea]|uniref:Uncharacterized protein n=1 Tax=Rickenella mellea TaxID=50990 RepID=A0A4Y7PIJ8_9AGAM|nr:hypothetical protein BD410DRAFT_809097 [Rickenella mellea]